MQTNLRRGSADRRLDRLRRIVVIVEPPLLEPAEQMLDARVPTEIDEGDCNG